MIKLRCLICEEDFSQPKYHGVVKEIPMITPYELKPLNQMEINGAMSDMERSGLSPQEWAKTISLEEPIKASIYSDGEIKIQDGHHRFLAAKILNKPLRVNMTAINTKMPILQSAIERIKSKVNVTLKEEVTSDIQSASVLSPDFIEFIKSVENPNRIGFKNGKWYPHQSPEGGLPTIGYGHKLTHDEVDTFSRGIDDKAVLELLKRDLMRAQDVVHKEHKHWVIKRIKKLQQKFPNNDFYKNLKPTDPVFKLDADQLNMLTEFVYNLGGLKSFPTFTDAVFSKDWKTAKMEYKRSYSDKTGKRKELVARNDAFFKTFLANKK